MITVITRRVWKQILHPSLFTLLFMSLFSCSDQNDLGSDSISGGTKTEDNIGIAFKGKVVSSQQATRADISIVHLGETNLKATSVSKFNVGLFGCHTGKYTWTELVKLSNTTFEDRATALSGFSNFSDLAALTDENAFKTEKASILKNYYTANLLYNTKATIESDGSLTYEPVRFWPNNLLPGSTTQHEYCTFWAYYPYNPTAEIGDYGISLTPEKVGEGTGMGRVKFTMQPDAANQNDFMISWPAVDCNRDIYPLVESPQGTYTPKPVSLRFFHMLAQVRLYAYIRGTDRMVYVQEDGKDKVADAKWLATQSVGSTIADIYGNVYTIKSVTTDAGVATAATIEQTTRKDGLTADQITEYECGDLDLDAFLALGLKVPDESQCQRWERTNIWDMKHTRRRSTISYQMEFNNIKTTTTFYPDYSSGSASIAYEPATTLGSATVNNYIMNPYWFHFNANNERDYLDDEFMFNKFEDTWAYKDGNKLSYKLDNNNKDDGTKHYNYAPGNVLLVVPQKLDDDDVPHIVLTAKGKDAKDSSKEHTARLTINMLKMNIEWKSGYIYCYAILDDLRPGDDIVRGPESITTIFDTNQYTDQW